MIPLPGIPGGSGAGGLMSNPVSGSGSDAVAGPINVTSGAVHFAPKQTPGREVVSGPQGMVNLVLAAGVVLLLVAAAKGRK